MHQIIEAAEAQNLRQAELLQGEHTQEDKLSCNRAEQPKLQDKLTQQSNAPQHPRQEA